jgi:hypothetical protein
MKTVFKLKILPHHAFMIAIKDGRIIVLTISSFLNKKKIKDGEGGRKMMRN